MIFTCKKLVESASEYIDGPNTWWEDKRMAMHLSICKHCRQYRKQLDLARHCEHPNQQPLSESEINQLANQLSHYSD